MSNPLTTAMRHWLPSQRPRWAMMPARNAALLVETLLTALSVIERAGVAYTVHQGTLLGVTRLAGLLPWDIDADLALYGENAESAAAKLRQPLHEHGLALLFSREHYYYTIRPLAAIQLPWAKHITVQTFPLIEVMLLTATIDPVTGELWYDRHSPRRSFAPGELLPLKRYPFYDGYVFGPAQAEPVLQRLYGEAGDGAHLANYRAAALDEQTRTFWRNARPGTAEADFAAVRERARTRKSWSSYAKSAPWYVANGLYNALTQAARRSVGGR